MTRKSNLDVQRKKTSLIATFSKADPPLVWHFDLERNHSFTLALQGDDHDWELGVMSLKGEFNPVARFPVREDAEEALAAIGGVLAEDRFAWVLGSLRLLGIFVLALLIVELGAAGVMKLLPASQPQVVEIPQEAPPPQPETPPPSPPPPSPSSQTGVPLPADSILKPPN